MVIINIYDILIMLSVLPFERGALCGTSIETIFLVWLDG
jgi:hypothetical protein